MSADPNFNQEASPILLNEVQLLLAEKRTSLAVLRTGIAVLALPLSILSFLIVTSKYYDLLHRHTLSLLLPVVGLCLVLLALGGYLVLRSIRRMRQYDTHIAAIKKQYSAIGALLS